MVEQIGIYGGTFNPIHFGHLNLAIELKEKKKLSDVWVIPAKLSPFRTNEKEVSPDHRFKMAQIAFEEIPGFQVLDIEMKRPAPSYTLDTIKELKASYPNKKFYLFLGEDTLQELMNWKGIEELTKEISLLIGRRKDIFSKLQFPEWIQQKVADGWVTTRKMDISATEIRERFQKGLYCGHLVPAKVLDYICENQLYFEA